MINRAWMNNFGDFLEAQRKRLNISQREFARRLQMSNSTFSKHVNPDVNKRPLPSLKLLRMVANVTQTDFNVVLNIGYPGLTFPSGDPAADMVLLEQLYKEAPEHAQRAAMAVLLDAVKGRK